VLCELNDQIFEHLLPWLDLSHANTAESLAHQLVCVKPFLFAARKSALFDALVRATATALPQPALRLDRHAAGRAVERALALAKLRDENIGGGGGGGAAGAGAASAMGRGGSGEPDIDLDLDLNLNHSLYMYTCIYIYLAVAGACHSL